MFYCEYFETWVNMDLCACCGMTAYGDCPFWEKEQRMKETVINNETWPDCPDGYNHCNFCTRWKTKKEREKNCEVLKKRHNTLRRKIYAIKKENKA